MTARDEAIEAMLSVAQDLYDHDWWRLAIAEMVDAIPSNLLARLAIERGALIEVEILDEYAGSSEVVDHGTYTPVGQATLYRVVEP